jgi:hypothetical protein
MSTCKCGALKLDKVKATWPCEIQMGCPICKTTVKVTV